MVVGKTGLRANAVKLTYEQASQMYRKDQIGKLAESEGGLRFLLLKSLDRPAYEHAIAKSAGIAKTNLRGKSRVRNLFASHWSTEEITKCIAQIYRDEREKRRLGEELLVAELYKMKSFDWGGLYQNALEKTIVNQYVKKIRQFDSLNERIDNELMTSMRGYVRCSWYNHWTSILIEDIFKDQAGVIPAVGLVKKVDFFIDRVPFDLKVTYLPEEFVKERRKSKGLPTEISLLKKLAKQKNSSIDTSLSSADLLEHLWLRLADDPDPRARALIDELNSVRKQLVDEVKADPQHLMKWLYENQGVGRFDAANRLFLILINPRNYFESWKLKRARSMLARHIEEFISRGRGNIGQQINFKWGEDTYTTFAAMLVIEHEA